MSAVADCSSTCQPRSEIAARPASRSAGGFNQQCQPVVRGAPCQCYARRVQSSMPVCAKWRYLRSRDRHPDLPWPRDRAHGAMMPRRTRQTRAVSADEVDLTQPKKRVVAVQSLPYGGPEERSTGPERRSGNDRRLRGTDVFYHGPERRSIERRARAAPPSRKAPRQP
jgi:hypothetical protein